MAIVHFTPQLERHTQVGRCEASGHTVRELLNVVFEIYPCARSYILDDQGAVRPHVVIFVDGEQIQDRTGQSDAVSADSELYLMQALSGG